MTTAVRKRTHRMQQSTSRSEGPMVGGRAEGRASSRTSAHLQTVCCFFEKKNAIVPLLGAVGARPFPAFPRPSTLPAAPFYPTTSTEDGDECHRALGGFEKKKPGPGERWHWSGGAGGNHARTLRAGAIRKTKRTEWNWLWCPSTSLERIRASASRRRNLC